MQSEIKPKKLTSNTSTASKKEIMVNGMWTNLGLLSTNGTLFLNCPKRHLSDHILSLLFLETIL